MFSSAAGSYGVTRADRRSHTLVKARTTDTINKNQDPDSDPPFAKNLPPSLHLTAEDGKPEIGRPSQGLDESDPKAIENAR
ncbi:hypothetical protein GCK32_013798 [Trichostrongylus colubriformis]|uniref:Uncharacterized protein n=1 Tax=Trichostrongylus colubriformis TaxID=6319 RepID=A0AAN8G8B0_TRICO